MKIEVLKNKIILDNVDNFIPKDVVECGQLFRWKKEDDDSYTIIAHGRVINISSTTSKRIEIDNCNLDDFNNIWKNYFDLNTNYSNIIEKLSTDDVMKTSTEFGKGIRILNQDNFEMMISFMISANNRIPMIQKVISNLSNSFGKYIGNYRGEEYFSFPTLDEFSEVTVDDIKNCKAGFRSERIKEACDRLLNNPDELEKLYSIDKMDYVLALDFLKSYKGIGNKVANCVLLFAGNNTSAFPVDVWVRRIMQFYYPLDDKSDKLIEKFADEKFGDLSGYAQQYLFYYARENGLNKK